MKALLLTIVLLGIDFGQIQAQTIHRGDGLYTFLTNFPSSPDSTVQANIEITTTKDTGMLKWNLDKTNFGDSLLFLVDDGMFTRGRIDSLMIFELNYFNDNHHTSIMFKKE